MSVSNRKKTGCFEKEIGSGSMVRCLQNKHVTSVRRVSAFVYTAVECLLCLHIEIYILCVFWAVPLEVEFGSRNLFI